MATIQRKIVTLLEGVDRPLTPQIIAKNIKANPNSVRSEISKLLKKGILIREFYGHYSLNPNYGVGSEKPPRVQNLHFQASGLKVPRRMRDLVIHLDGDARITLQFGSKRGRINWYVSVPDGFDHHGLVLSKKLVDRECLTRGFKNLKWMCKS